METVRCRRCGKILHMEKASFAELFATHNGCGGRVEVMKSGDFFRVLHNALGTVTVAQYLDGDPQCGEECDCLAFCGREETEALSLYTILDRISLDPIVKKERKKKGG